MWQVSKSKLDNDNGLSLQLRNYLHILWLWISPNLNRYEDMFGLTILFYNLTVASLAQ